VDPPSSVWHALEVSILARVRHGSELVLEAARPASKQGCTQDLTVLLLRRTTMRGGARLQTSNDLVLEATYDELSHY